MDAMAGFAVAHGYAFMKQKLDEVRTLAIKLYEAAQKEKRKQPKEIWGGSGRDCTWRDLPTESLAVWDAVAICAYEQLKRHNERAKER